MAAATRVQMTCAAVAQVQTSLVPAGYRVREYGPGDELAWVAIHRLADLHNPALRVPALNLYSTSGFLPDLDPPEAGAAWARLIDPAAPPDPPLRPGFAAWLRAHLQ